MVNKGNNSKKIINAEKYMFIILLMGYILGISIGSFFVLSNPDNANFTNNVLSDGTFKVLLYFIIALLLKYSGILSGLLIILPMFLGIHNSAGYSCFILNNSIKYKTALTILKDTAIVMLLIFYIILIVNQIINKKYNLKKDFKYFIIYFIASSVVLITEYTLTNIIF